MILAGDEFGRSQQGNNNAYCQDNEISWVDWNYGERGEQLIRFVERLTRLRRQYAVLRRNRFLTGDWNEELGIKDATWLAPTGEEMSSDQWQDAQAKCLGVLLDGRAQVSGIAKHGSDATLLLVLNGYHDLVVFKLPDGEKRSVAEIVALPDEESGALFQGPPALVELAKPNHGELIPALGGLGESSQLFRRLNVSQPA